MNAQLVGNRWRLQKLQLTRTPELIRQLAVDGFTIEELEARNPVVWAVIDRRTDPALMAEILTTDAPRAVHGTLAFEYDREGRISNLSFLLTRLHD
jgi:hypothetical protein